MSEKFIIEKPNSQLISIFLRANVLEFNKYVDNGVKVN